MWALDSDRKLGFQVVRLSHLEKYQSSEGSKGSGAFSLGLGPWGPRAPSLGILSGDKLDIIYTTKCCLLVGKGMRDTNTSVRG